jgi:DNA-directed RNA polymerase specialized sigma24 family protein
MDDTRRQQTQGDNGADKRPQSQPLKDLPLEAGDEELMTRLTAGYQEILRAKGSYIEIASSLGIAVGTVRSRLHRARSALVKLRQSRFGHTGNGKTRDMAH